MNLAQATGDISFFILILVACAFIFKHKQIKANYIFFLLCLVCLIYEGIVIVSSWYGIPNHIVANINTIIYFPLAVLLIFNIIEFIRGKSRGTVFFRWAIIILLYTGWCIENFVTGTIWIYNMYTAAFVSVILVLATTYLINVLIFIKTESIFKDSDSLLLTGILARAFAGSLISLFFNLRFQYSPDFYKHILFLYNLALIVSDLLFLFAVICLPQKKKYTWPF